MKKKRKQGTTESSLLSVCGAPSDCKETFVNDRTWGPKEEDGWLVVLGLTAL